MKKTQKHTQGQWQAIEARVYNRFTVFGEPSSQMICSCYVSGDYTPIAEQNANAKLIAAAPDLLQVTKDFLLLAALHDWEGAAIDFAKATLAKAEGVK
jgi:hypothetical protein